MHQGCSLEKYPILSLQQPSEVGVIILVTQRNRGLERLGNLPEDIKYCLVNDGMQITWHQSGLLTSVLSLWVHL